MKEAPRPASHGNPRRKPLPLAILALLLVAAVGKPEKEATVGMIGRLDQVILPGPELEAKPQENRDAPLVVRVVDTYPHGPDGFRYDLEFTGFVPGVYDLRYYLRRKDGQPADPSLKGPFVEIKSVLPPGQIPPRDPAAARVRGLGGYRGLLLFLGTVWAAGLAAMLWAGRRRKSAEAQATAITRPPTLAERLQPLVEQATAGTIEPARLAELERLLLDHWSRRLGLHNVPPAQLIDQLRRHEQAGPLVRQLEQWLHAPEGGREAVNVTELLSPYRELPVDEVDPMAEAAGGGGSRP